MEQNQVLFGVCTLFICVVLLLKQNLVVCTSHAPANFPEGFPEECSLRFTVDTFTFLNLISCDVLMPNKRYITAVLLLLHRAHCKYSHQISIVE